MRFGKTITAAVLGLGISILTPTLSNAAERRTADRGHENVQAHVQQSREDHRVEERKVVVEHRDVDRGRDDHRVEVRRGPDVHVVIPSAPIYVAPTYTPDVDTRIAIGQVPSFVLDTEARFAGGLRIDAINYVQTPGQSYYEFRLDRASQGHVIVRVAADGQFLGYL